MVSTFGYTTLGTQALTPAGYIDGTCFVNPYSGMVGSEMWVAMRRNTAGTSQGQLGIYNKTDGSLVATTGSFTIVQNGVYDWYSMPFSPYPPLSANTSYVLVVMASGPAANTFMACSAISGFSEYYQTITWPTFPNPATWTFASNTETTIYVKLDVSGVAPQSFSQILSETFTMGDGTRKLDSIYKADTAQVLDYILKYPSMFKTETVTMADSLRKAGSIWKVDTMTVADSLRKSDVAGKSDSITFTDSKWFQNSTLKGDTITMADSNAKSVSKTFVETR